jgi:transposase
MLNATEKRGIITACRDGISSTVTGKKYGVSASAVRQVFNRDRGVGFAFERGQRRKNETAAVRKIETVLADFDDAAKDRIRARLARR